MLGLLALVGALGAAPGDIDVWRPSPAHPRVVLATNRSAPDATLRITFRAGAADDGIEYGRTRLSQIAIIEAQKGYEALDAAIYAAGATLELETSVRDCTFVLTAPRAAFDALAPKLLAHVLAPKIDKARFPQARRRATHDYLQAGSEEDLLAFVAGQVLLTEGVEGGGDYNNPLWGDPETLPNIGLASVEKHVHTKMVPANAVVFAAGNFDVGKLKAAVAKHKGGKERALRRPELLKYLPLEFSRWAPVEVHMHLQVVDVRDAKAAAMVHVLAALLHERVFWRLRRTGHTYSPVVAPYFEEWLDFLLVFFTVTPGLKEDPSGVMYAALDDIAAGNFTDEELARARAIARARLEDLAENPTRMAQALEPSSRGVPTLGPEVLVAIDGVERGGLGALAAKELARDHSVNVLFGRSRAKTGPRPSAGD